MFPTSSNYLVTGLMGLMGANGLNICSVNYHIIGGGTRGTLEDNTDNVTYILDG